MDGDASHVESFGRARRRVDRLRYAVRGDAEGRLVPRSGRPRERPLSRRFFRRRQLPLRRAARRSCRGAARRAGVRARRGRDAARRPGPAWACRAPPLARAARRQLTAAAGVASGVKSGRYIDRVNRLLALLPFCAAVAAGCGESAAPAAADGAAVRASSDAITAQEADAALARSPHATRELAERARREAIDRAPRVLQAMEAAKSEILARAYLQQVAQAQPRPSAEEVRNYYKQHPELFAQRRLFT